MKTLTKKGTLTKALEKAIEKEIARMATTSYEVAHLPGLKKTTDIVVGDVVGWFEPVFVGSYRNARLDGYRFRWGKIVKDSYSARGQHTFTIAENLDKAKILRKKGRTIFGVGAFTLQLSEDRAAALAEKHERGHQAKIAALKDWLAEHPQDHPRYLDKHDRLASLEGR